MSDVSREEFEGLLDAVSKLTQGLQSSILKNAKSQKDKEKSDKDEQSTRQKVVKSLRDFDRGFEDSTNRLKTMTSSADGAIAALNNIARMGKGFIGLGVFATLANEGLKLATSYQKMTEIGQTYGGSMLNMLESAAGAGLSLSDYMQVQTRYNKLISNTSHNFFDMQKQLRENISAQGSYGMTVDQINTLMGESMEASKRTGALEHRSSRQLISDFGDLALTSTALAKGSDKAREAIIQLANEATSSALSVAQIRLTTPALRGLVDKNLKEATMGFAALPGQAGEFFSKYFTSSFGGMAALTQQGETMVEAGLSGMVAEMDAMSRKFKAGTGTIDDQIAYQNRFIDEVDRNLPILQAQAMAGNQAAAQMIEMRSEMSKTTKAQLEAKKAAAANQDGLTAFFSSLESMFSLLINDGFIKSFLESFGDITFKMEEFAKSKWFMAIKDALSTLGSSLGSFMSDLLLDGDKAKDFSDFIVGMITALPQFASAVASIISFFGGVASVLSDIFGTIFSGFNAISENGSELAGKVAAWAVIIGMVGGKLLGFGKLLMGLFGRSVGAMNVKAGVVNIDDSGGGGGGRRGRRGRRGLRGRARMRAMRGRLGRLGGGLGRSLGGLGGLGRAAAGGGLAALGGMGLGYLADNYLTQGSLAQQATSVGASALSWGGTGALIGSVIPGLGTVAGGLIGGGLGALYGVYDQYSKANAASAAIGGAAGLAGGIEGLATPTPANDPMMSLNETMKKQTEELGELMRNLNGKIDRANRLLAKIEIHAQSL